MMPFKPSWLLIASFALLSRLAAGEPCKISLPFPVMAVDINFACYKDLKQMDIIVSDLAVNGFNPYNHGFRVRGNGKTCEMETGVFSKDVNEDFTPQPYARQTKPISVAVTNPLSTYQASFYKESFFLTKNPDQSPVFKDLNQGVINPQTLYFYGDQMPLDIYIRVPRGLVKKGKPFMAFLFIGTHESINIEFQPLKPYGAWKGKVYREFGTIYHYSFSRPI